MENSINSLFIGKHFYNLQKFAQKFPRTSITKNVIVLITNENIKELMGLV